MPTASPRMSKSGLFAHFQSKEEVQIGLLGYMDQVGRASFIQPAMNASEGLPRFKALVQGWFGWAQRAGLPGGCPVAAGLFEFDDIESPVRDKILAMEGQWRVFLTELVQRAIALGHLRSDLDVEQFIWELSGIYLSHHAAHRFLRSRDADRRAHKRSRTERRPCQRTSRGLSKTVKILRFIVDSS